MDTGAIILLLLIFCFAMITFIAFFFHRQYKSNAVNQKRINDMKKMLKKQYEDRVHSIDVIARAMIDKQCELAEGCIRVKQLLDYVEADLLTKDPYKVIALMYSETEHMPIKEQWKQLDKAAKKKFTLQRVKLEDRHEEAIHAAAVALQQHEFAPYESLN